MKLIHNIIFLFFLFVANLGFSQESLDLQLSGGAAYIKHYYIPSDTYGGHCNVMDPIINIPNSWSPTLSLDLFFRVSKYFQFELGFAYQGIVLDYTYYHETPICTYSEITSEANVYQGNELFQIPFGGSLILPLNKSDILLGANIRMSFSSINKHGTWQRYGKENIQFHDSTITYDEVYEIYTDNEIADILSPRLRFQIHLGYQLQVAENWKISARLKATNGSTHKNYSFWQYGLQFGVVYRLYNYNSQEN